MGNQSWMIAAVTIQKENKNLVLSTFCQDAISSRVRSLADLYFPNIEK